VSAQRSWSVPGTVVRIIDGDTVEMNLDLGWRVWMMKVAVRLSGINCPEMNTEAGRAARARVVQLCPPGAEVQVISKSLDKYGRVLGTVILPGLAMDDLAMKLFDEGHAELMSG
jgi:endonuclease YncB( thermonuclease family)